MVDNVRTEYHNSPRRNEDKDPHYRWWLAKEDQAHEDIHSVVSAITENQRYNHTNNLRFYRLYANKEVSGFSNSAYSRTAVTDQVQNRVTYNVVKSCIDSITNKIAKNRPRPRFLTTKGDYSMQRRAKKLTQYMDGAFDSANAYEIGQKVFTDSCTFGTGVMKIYREHDKIKVERIFIDDLVVDDAEAMYGEPRQMHQTKYINRDVLLDMYPDHADKILAATSDKKAADQSVSDALQVVESWHLMSGPDATDGRHIISIDNATLMDEEYKKDYFPFVFMRWTDALLGFFGSGLAEELTGIQLEINKILRNIQKAINLVAVPRVYVQNSSKIVSDHIQNTIGAIVKHTGNPPTFHTPTAMNPEVYRHLDNLYQKAFEITGVSMLSATSKKPAGLNSGAALREYNDVETERFLTVAQRYEKFFVDVAKVFVDQSRDMYEEDKGLKVKASSDGFIESIKWKDVNIEEDKYTLRCFPTSLLPTLPSARMQKVMEWVQAGWISMDTGKHLAEFPDTDEEMRLQAASKDNVKRVIEQMLDEGKYESPEPELNLEEAIQLTQLAYLRAKLDGVPNDRRELLQIYIEECHELTPLPPEPVAAPVPQAVPEAMPTSDMMPMV